MDETDKKLNALLRLWPGLEPSPTFEQDVLRRIRLDRVRPDARRDASGIWGWLPAWLASPGRAAVAAGCVLTLALAAGVAGGWTLPPPDGTATAPMATRFSLVAPGTIAGNYLAMTGGQRQ